MRQLKRHRGKLLALLCAALAWLGSEKAIEGYKVILSEAIAQAEVL